MSSLFDYNHVHPWSSYVIRTREGMLKQKRKLLVAADSLATIGWQIQFYNALLFIWTRLGAGTAG